MYVKQHLIKNNRHRIPEVEAAAIVESSCEVLAEQEGCDDRRQCRPRKRHSDYDCATAGTKSAKIVRATAPSWDGHSIALSSNGLDLDELVKCAATCTGLSDVMCNLCVTFGCEFEGATELLKDQMVKMSDAAGPNDDASND